MPDALDLTEYAADTHETALCVSERAPDSPTIRRIRERVTASTQMPVILASADERIGDMTTDASWGLRALVASPFAACALRLLRQRHPYIFEGEEPDPYGWRLVIAGSGKRGGREAIITLNVTAPGGYTGSLDLGSLYVDGLSRQTVLRAIRQEWLSPLSPFAPKLAEIACIGLGFPPEAEAEDSASLLSAGAPV